MILTISETIKNWAEDFKEFVIEQGENPLFWIIAFFLGIVIFWITYGALHKDK